MKLYQKGLLAFAIVILIAIITVALLVGQRTETELRQYTALYSNRAQNLALALTNYYRDNGSWDGLHTALPNLNLRSRGQHSVGQYGGQTSTQAGGNWDFRVIDIDRTVIADSQGIPQGTLTPAELKRALALSVGEQVVGYLLPDTQSHTVPLDATSEQLLARVRSALFVGGLVAFLAAMLLAGILTQGILAPVRALTKAAETVADGDLETRAAVRGQDEIAHLAEAFNTMTESLQQAEQARQSQTADIAHELRNPLSILQGTLEALADGIYNPTPENIQPALDQVRTLNRLVDDLRTLALADAGQLQLHRQPLEITDLVSRIVDAYREALTDKGITVQFQIADSETPIPIVSADYERLTQVLNNIFTNVLRYVSQGCAVHVIIKAEKTGVTVRIIDNGPGVPADELPRLFERFWRSEPSRSRTTGGSGLGLAIAHYVITAHKGRIWAETTPGGGLTLAFWLPAAD